MQLQLSCFCSSCRLATSQRILDPCSRCGGPVTYHVGNYESRKRKTEATAGFKVIPFRPRPHPRRALSRFDRS